MISLNRSVEIRIAGFGGQGVVTIGRILGMAFTLFDGINSVNTQSYGPESRGGACRSELVVSGGEINYPYVRRADLFVALSQPALDAYIGDLKKDGILVADSDGVNHLPDAGDLRIHKIPMITLAHEVGDVTYQNMVALGAVFAVAGHWVTESSLLRAMGQVVPPHTLEANKTAFQKGKEWVMGYEL